MEYELWIEEKLGTKYRAAYKGVHLMNKYHTIGF